MKFERDQKLYGFLYSYFLGINKMFAYRTFGSEGKLVLCMIQQISLRRQNADQQYF